LLGIVKHHLGRVWFLPAFCSIVGGLVLTLVAYLILAPRFIHFVFPGISPTLGVLMFWSACSLPLLFGLRRLLTIEFLSSILMLGFIAVLFGTAEEPSRIFSLPAAIPDNFFLPFGAVLFALAGWTAIEPIHDAFSRDRCARVGMILGSVFAALTYVLFVMAIIGSDGLASSDVVSGLAGWPFWKMVMTGVFAVLLIADSYVPISWEIKNAFERDLHWPKPVGLGLVVVLPALLYFLGLTNFIAVVGLVGGVFLAIEYLFIVFVARRVLRLSLAECVATDCLTVLFLLAVVYEIFYFVT
jgi:hypothetical protein